MMKPKQFRIDHASDIIFCTDIEGYFTYVNASAPVIMQRTAEELLGLHYLQLIPPGYRKAAGRFYRDQITSGTPASYYEYPVIKGDGSLIWLGQNVETMCDESGQAVGFQAWRTQSTASATGNGPRCFTSRVKSTPSTCSIASQ